MRSEKERARAVALAARESQPKRHTPQTRKKALAMVAALLEKKRG